MSGTTNTTKKLGHFQDSFLEQLADTVKKEPKKFASTAASSLLGKLPITSENGDQAHGSPEVYPARPRQEKQKTPEIQLFSFRERQNNLDVNYKIEALMKEIRHMIIAIDKDQKSLLNDAAKITVEQLPQNPGIYHIHFLEWVLRTLTDLKKKVSESATWFSMVVGKRKKMGYWGMAKKHGTTFSMSNERTIATQSG
jgi:hypothetical protein